ncbi:MAG: hypothetical protein ACI9IZ_000524 [Nonlabens sp.]|jgi:hypothetical protein
MKTYLLIIFTFLLFTSCDVNENPDEIQSNCEGIDCMDFKNEFIVKSINCVPQGKCYTWDFESDNYPWDGFNSFGNSTVSQSGVRSNKYSTPTGSVRNFNSVTIGRIRGSITPSVLNYNIGVDIYNPCFQGECGSGYVSLYVGNTLITRVQDVFPWAEFSYNFESSSGQIDLSTLNPNVYQDLRLEFGDYSGDDIDTYLDNVQFDLF